MAKVSKPPRTPERAMVTPEGVTLNLRLASAGSRASAFLIDSVILIAVMIAATLLALLAFWVIGHDVPSLIVVLWMLVYFLLRNFYFIWMESGRRAATWGKRAMKLRVVARDGGRLTGSAIVARNMMREMEIFLPLMFLLFGSVEGFVNRWWAGIGLAWTAIFLFLPAFNRDKLRAGDIVAGTWVVENVRPKIGADLLAEAQTPPPALQFTPEELATYGQFELQKLEEILRRDDVDAITMVAAAIRRKLGRDARYPDRVFLDAYYAALRAELERKLLFGKRKRDKFDDAA